MTVKTRPHKITSFAAPTEADKTALAATPEMERRALIETEIDKGFAGPFRKVSKQEIKVQVLAM